MRKSERIRMLELNMLKLQMEVELLQGIVGNLLEKNSLDIDAGKWYNRSSRPDIPNN